jgi:hypothetical protein
MADIALTVADRVNVVESLEQKTAPAAEAIVAGAPVRYDTATGRFTNANATVPAEARAYGLATRTVPAGMPVTAIRRGYLDGFDLSGLAYDADVFLSDTDGRLADAAGTESVAVGVVAPAFATTLGTAADKILYVAMP